MTKELHPRDHIAGLDRGMAVLECFNQDHPMRTATEVAATTGMTRSAARRYLLTFEHLGYLYSEGKQFGLTPRALKIGWSYFDSAALPRVLRPFMQRVTALTGESVYASVLEKQEVVFIAKTPSTRVMTSSFDLGSRAPAQLSSTGIMQLALQPDEDVEAALAATPLIPFTPYTFTNTADIYREIERARTDGYAVIEQQLHIGIRGIAVPLKNRHGVLIGALSVSVPMANESQEQARARVLPVLQETANTLINHL